MLTCTSWGVVFIKVLKSFQLYTARSPSEFIELWKAICYPCSHLPCFHVLQLPDQLVPCKEWVSCKLLFDPHGLSTCSKTTSTMRLPPPFLLLFRIKYVRIINVSTAKSLGIHIDPCSLWIQLKGYSVWIQKTWDQMPALPFCYVTFLFHSSTTFWFGHPKNGCNTLPISSNVINVQ